MTDSRDDLLDQINDLSRERDDLTGYMDCLERQVLQIDEHIVAVWAKIKEIDEAEEG